MTTQSDFEPSDTGYPAISNNTGTWLFVDHLTDVDRQKLRDAIDNDE